MAEPFIGEIRIFAGSYAPQGWVLCNGAGLPISGNEALFTLLGTIYGGDGQTNFAVPDLRGRAAMSLGQSTAAPNTTYVAGQKAGTENVMLTLGNIPAHTHAVNASAADATATTAGSSVLLAAAKDTTVGQIDGRYLPDGKATTGTAQVLNAAEVAQSSGPVQPLNNMMPSLALTYIIATVGIFPSA
jgi:microcystin-dependent protein